MDKEGVSRQETVIKREIEDELKESFLSYAMSVIVSRALPDVRDGLKPVHRRILYAMKDLANYHDKPYKKSVKIVGQTMGNYHPHGDSAIYESLVRMAQEFSLRYPLVDGQGNFGSIDGDPPAAMRYCITGDSLLLTHKGIIPIREISKGDESDIDIQIINYKGKIKRASKFFNSGEHKIIRLETSEGYEIRGSKNHPVLCWTKTEIGFPIIMWKLLEEVTMDDYIVINRNFSLFSKTNFPINTLFPKPIKREKKVSLPKTMNKYLAFLLGALVAEGNFHQKKIIFNNKDLDFYNKVKKCILENFPEIKLYERGVKGDCKQLEMYHQKVVRFFNNIGFHTAKSHQIVPFTVLQSKKEVIREFLMALFEGDGSVRVIQDKRHKGKSIDICYHSKSKELIMQLKVLLLNFGVITNKLYIDKRSDCYKLTISGAQNVLKFKKQIGFFSKKKNDKLSEVKDYNKTRMSKIDFIPFLSQYLRENYHTEFITKNNFDRYNNLEEKYEKLKKILNHTDLNLVDWLLKNKYFFNKVKIIEKLEKEEIVYSIKVESKCHSFIANGFVNHNTEVRLARLAEEILEDINKDTVNFIPNYNEELTEPVVLPSKIPNLLINGSSGIAVGMATNIPPHNLNEVCDGMIHLINNPNAEIKEIMDIIKGPDFPTYGFICGRNGIIRSYLSGRGKVVIKSKCHIETKGEKKDIIFTEIPYQVNKSQLLEEIASLVKSDKIREISDIRDESNKEGIRMVICLKKNVNEDVVLNQLYKYSRLKTTFGTNMVVLVNGEPRTLNLKQILAEFIKHRKEVVTRRTEYDLKQAKEKEHKLEGLVIALDNIDNVVALIKSSKSAEEAIQGLMNNYSLSIIQSKNILEMRLQRLTGLEQEKLRKDLEEVKELIKELEIILSDENNIFNVIKKETLEIKEKYGDSRRTQILEEEGEIEIEDLIEEEVMVVTLTKDGYVKRVPLSIYKTQNRGGRGVIATGTKDEDFVKDVFVASTHDTLLCFTKNGIVHWLKVYNIPQGSRQSKGKAIINLLNLKDDSPSVLIPLTSFDHHKYLLFCTEKGYVKKTSLSEYSRQRKGGIIAITLENDDRLIDVLTTDGEHDILLATIKGSAIRFSEKEARPVGRSARGVRGIRLRKEDKVVSAVYLDKEIDILTITKKGYGKRTPSTDYRTIGRSGKGVRNIKVTEKNGDVVHVLGVVQRNEVMLISRKGIIIRIEVHNVSRIGRNTQGVRLMNLGSDDEVVAATKVLKEEDEINEIKGGDNMEKDGEKGGEFYPEESEETLDELNKEVENDEIYSAEEGMVKGYLEDEFDTMEKSVDDENDEEESEDEDTE